MKKHLRISKGLHWITLLCFFLPFFYTGCGESAEEKAKEEKAKADSIATSEAIRNICSNNTDTANIITAATATIIDQHDSIPSELNTDGQNASMENNVTPGLSEPLSNKDSKSASERIVGHFPFLKPLLTPKENTFTGIGTVLDVTPFIFYYGLIFICFLFLIITLVIKYMEKGAVRTIGLIETIAFICLFFSNYPLISEKLWGYWVGLSFLLALLIYDFYLIFIKKHPVSQNPAG